MTDLRKAAEQALEVLEQIQGGCTDSDDGTVEAITVWCPEVIEDLRAALAAEQAPDAEALRAEVDALRNLLARALPIIDADACMMADLTRHAPLTPEAQAIHDSTEYESERLVREIRAAMARAQKGK